MADPNKVLRVLSCVTAAPLQIKVESAGRAARIDEPGHRHPRGKCQSESTVSAETRLLDYFWRWGRFPLSESRSTYRAKTAISTMTDHHVIVSVVCQTRISRSRYTQPMPPVVLAGVSGEASSSPPSHESARCLSRAGGCQHWHFYRRLEQYYVRLPSMSLGSASGKKEKQKPLSFGLCKSLS